MSPILPVFSRHACVPRRAPVALVAAVAVLLGAAGSAGAASRPVATPAVGFLMRSPGDGGASSPARSVTYEGHQVSVTALTVTALRAPAAKGIGALDRLGLREQPVGRNRVAITLAPRGHGYVGGVDPHACSIVSCHLNAKQQCVLFTSAVLLGLGALGVTVVIIAIGPDAGAALTIAGRTIPRAQLIEVQKLTAGAGTLTGFVSNKVCR